MRTEKTVKRIAALALGLVFALTSVTGCKSSGSDEDGSVRTVKIGTMNVSDKTAFLDDDGNLTGYEIELLKKIDERLEQYKFEFVQLEGAALFSSLDADNVQMVTANFRRSDAREASYIHTYYSYIYTPYRIIVFEDNTDINSIEDLDGKTVGIGEGSLMATIMEAYVADTGADINLVYVTDAVSDMVAGRIDCTVAPERTVDIYNESYENLSFKAVGDPVIGTDGCMKDSNAYWWFKQGDEELRDAISEALYGLRQEGFLTELSIEWYGKDLTANIDTECEKEVQEMYGISK